MIVIVTFLAINELKQPFTPLLWFSVRGKLGGHCSGFFRKQNNKWGHADRLNSSGDSQPGTLSYFATSVWTLCVKPDKRCLNTNCIFLLWPTKGCLLEPRLCRQRNPELATKGNGQTSQTLRRIAKVSQKILTPSLTSGRCDYSALQTTQSSSAKLNSQSKGNCKKGKGQYGEWNRKDIKD